MKDDTNSGYPLQEWFSWEHLPDHLAEVTREFDTLCRKLDKLLGPGRETSTAYRKLLEAKDAAVRARLEKERSKASARAEVLAQAQAQAPKKTRPRGTSPRTRKTSGKED